MKDWRENKYWTRDRLGKDDLKLIEEMIKDGFGTDVFDKVELDNIEYDYNSNNYIFGVKVTYDYDEGYEFGTLDELPEGVIKNNLGQRMFSWKNKRYLIKEWSHEYDVFNNDSKKAWSEEDMVDFMADIVEEQKLSLGDVYEEDKYELNYESNMLNGKVVGEYVEGSYKVPQKALMSWSVIRIN